MDSSSRSLRFALLAMVVANSALASVFLFKPDVLSQLYDNVALDGMHAYLASSYGALLMVMAVGALLAFAHPTKYAGMVLLLIIAQFGLFTSDVVQLARSQMKVMTLLPEMLYFLITAVLLIRYYPVEVKQKKKDKEAKQEPMTPEKIEEPLFDDKPKADEVTQSELS